MCDELYQYVFFIKLYTSTTFSYENILPTLKLVEKENIEEKIKKFILRKCSIIF